MTLKWEFLKRRAMTMSADQMANPLGHTSLTKAEILMREGIQNSVDERRKDTNELVKFVVRRLALRGDEKRTFVDRFLLAELRDRSRYFPKRQHWFEFEGTCLSSLDDPDVPIPVIVLSDHSTNGLGGTWNRREGLENRFHNLVLSINTSEKQEAKGALGSYGVGKMVYAVTSNIRTMAYYSSFDPTEATDNASARFMATAFLPTHDVEDGQFTGHAFLGEESGDESYPSKPLVDSEAHDFAQLVGLERRSGNDTGLSVMLLDCHLDMAECARACETYWWPRLLEEDQNLRLEIELYDEDKRMSDPRPRSRDDLNPFIDCHNNLRQDTRPEGYELHKILPRRGKPGKLCLKGLTIPAGKAPEDIPLANTAALIRGGLVIKYDTRYAREGEEGVAVGVFEASGEDAIKAFTMSEPEAHDDWNPHLDRLVRNLGDGAVRLVKGTHADITNKFRDFQLRLTGTRDKPVGDGLDFLDKLLGPLFKSRKKGLPDPVPVKPRAFSITKRGSRDASGEPAFDKLDFTIALADGVTVEAEKCRVDATLRVLADADGRPGERVSVEICSEDGQVVAMGRWAEFRVDLVKGSRLKFHAQAMVHKSWRTKWVVNVEREEREVEAS